MNPTKIGIACAIVLLPACDSVLTGNEGNFQFSYDADDRIGDFNKPVAVGAYLDLEVRDVGARQPVSLSAAAFAEAGVLEVTSFADQHVTIHGVGEGTALLEVEGTTAGGSTLTDSVNMLAAVPDVLVLRHTCDTDRDIAAYLTSSRAWVPFELERSNGQPVIGYGYYPIETLSGATMNVTDSNQTHMALDLGGSATTLTLTSTIDDTTLTMEVVTKAQIDGVVEPIAFVAEDIDVGDTNAFYVLPSTGGVPICQADVAKTVTSATPEICTVREREPMPGTADTSFEYGWFEVTGVKAGQCEYVVSYPDGADGSGVSATFTYEIQP